MVHKNDYALQKLLQLIDDKRNDIYIHVDKKSDISSFINLKSLLFYSEIQFTDRVSVEWGTYSQVEAELCLFKAASVHNYQCYHLISGADLPLKSQKEIQNFFDKNKDKEFIRFENSKFTYSERVNYYYVFQKNLRTQTMEKFFNKIFVSLQKLLHIKRNKNIVFQKGTNWVSITDDLIKFILSKEEWIQKTFNHTFCSDEIFIQTIVQNSTYFKNRLYRKSYDNNMNSIQRLIDWDRGTPYVFRENDLSELINSSHLFARKFDPIIDKNVIDLLADSIKKTCTIEGDLINSGKKDLI